MRPLQILLAVVILGLIYCASFGGGAFLLVPERTAALNRIRGLLSELGLAMTEG